MTAALVEGVRGVSSTICLVLHYSGYFSMDHAIALHWGDCHELYIWYYYCVLCKSWQKVAGKAVAHVHEHVHSGHGAGASRMRLTTMVRLNGSRVFRDPLGVKPHRM